MHHLVLRLEGCAGAMALEGRRRLSYVQFLREEAHLHVCPAGRQFGTPDWTPFRAGHLSQSARDSAARIASLLWDYLVVTRHAQANPFAAVVRKASEESAPRQANRGAVPPNVLDLVMTCMDRRQSRQPRTFASTGAIDSSCSYTVGLDFGLLRGSWPT